MPPLELHPEDPPALEKIVRAANSLLPIRTWTSHLTEIQNRVCRISFDNGGSLIARGSGFLVAADVVLTNHHVIAPVLAGEYQPKQLRAQFDHYELPDGSVEAGTIIHVAKDWVIASAPHDPIDTTVHDLTEEPEPGNLDFALLRLARQVGNDKIDAKGRRGWIDLDTTTTATNSAANAPVFIVQHAAGKPMQLALETDGVIGYSPKQRRIRYRTNTLAGSSGSPVFNENWKLLALHHLGDPKYPELDTGKYNEGIPIRTLIEYLEDKGILETLRKPGAQAKLDSIGAIEDIRPAPVSDDRDATQHRQAVIRSLTFIAYTVMVGVGLVPLLARYHVPGLTAVTEAFPVNLQKGLVPFATILMVVPFLMARSFAEDRVGRKRLNRYLLLVGPFVTVLVIMLSVLYLRYVVQVDFEGGSGSAVYVIGNRMLESCPCVSHKLDIGMCIGRVISASPAEVTACYDRNETNFRRTVLALLYLLTTLSLAVLAALLVLKAKQLQRAPMSRR